MSTTPKLVHDVSGVCNMQLKTIALVQPSPTHGPHAA